MLLLINGFLCVVNVCVFVALFSPYLYSLCVLFLFGYVVGVRGIVFCFCLWIAFVCLYVLVFVLLLCFCLVCVFGFCLDVFVALLFVRRFVFPAFVFFF